MYSLLYMADHKYMAEQKEDPSCRRGELHEM